MEDKKETENKNNKWNTVINKVEINPVISIITLNVNGPNTQLKRQRLSEWITKQDPTICCL